MKKRLLILCIPTTLAIAIAINPWLEHAWSQRLMHILMLLVVVIGIVSITSDIRKNAVLIERVSRRQTPRKINDIAGSVGRMAPLVRNIESRVVSLENNVVGIKSLPSRTLPTNGTTSSEALTSDTSGQQVWKGGSAKTNLPRSKYKVAVILDTFSEIAFAYEWDQVVLKKDTWREQLSQGDIDLLFVESAWEGSSGEWRYQFTGSMAPREDIVDLIHYCRQNHIPTAFWNKEDPVHYDDFLSTAKLFDHVFTTDSEVIDQYKQALNHNNVWLLPFAAQPAIHNPIRSIGTNRDKGIVFGGMYFRHKYPERREQMDYLLEPGAKYGLDIFSRQLGADPNYQFPPSISEHVVGSLTYPEMLEAYRKYKVVLNVNSVVTSPTMCARRIFEATACGAAVVSAYSPAVENYFASDEVYCVTNSREAESAYRILLRSDLVREKRVLRAQRRLWASDTYGHRVRTIMNVVFDAESSNDMPLVSVLVSTIRPHLIQGILERVSRQAGVNVELILNLHGVDMPRDEVYELASDYGFNDSNMIVTSYSRDIPLGECLNRMIALASGDLFAKMDDDDYYGVNYLIDQYNAWCYSGADVVGKADSFIHFESNKHTIRTYKNSGLKYGSFVRGATLFFGRSALELGEFGATNRSEDSAFLSSVAEKGGVIFASDRFNYCVIRYDDESHHTWSLDDEWLLGSGEVVNIGEFTSLVDC